MTALSWCALRLRLYWQSMIIVKPPKALKYSGREPPQVEPFEGLELYDGKLSRTVLRGAGQQCPLPYRLLHLQSKLCHILFTYFCIAACCNNISWPGWMFRRNILYIYTDGSSLRKPRRGYWHTLHLLRQQWLRTKVYTHLKETFMAKFSNIAQKAWLITIIMLISSASN